MPKRAQHIQQWLSSCDTNEQSSIPKRVMPLSKSISPNAQWKMCRFLKSVRPTSSSSPSHANDSLKREVTNEHEPWHFRTSLRIRLEKNESTNYQNRATSSTTKYPPLQKSIADEESSVTADEHFQGSRLSPSFQCDRQSVYL